MHLDTVFTFADRDRRFVDVVAEAMGYQQLRLVETAGDYHATERQQ